MPRTIDDMRKPLRSLNLRRVPNDTFLVSAKDAEGNDFSPIEESQLSFYLATSPYSRELFAESPDDFDPLGHTTQRVGAGPSQPSGADRIGRACQMLCEEPSEPPKYRAQKATTESKDRLPVATPNGACARGCPVVILRRILDQDRYHPSSCGTPMRRDGAS